MVQSSVLDIKYYLIIKKFSVAKTIIKNTNVVYWFMVYGLWFMVYGYGLWFMVYGLWFILDVFTRSRTERGNEW